MRIDLVPPGLSDIRTQKQMKQLKKLKRVPLKEELVALTGDYSLALVLQQMIFWQERTRDYEDYLRTELTRFVEGDHRSHGQSPGFVAIAETVISTHFINDGWFHKTADDLSAETLMNVSRATMRRHMAKLVGMGIVAERDNPDPHYGFDKTKQYRVDLAEIQTRLMKIGYQLEGYKFDEEFAKYAAL